MRVVKYQGKSSDLWNTMLILQPLFAACLAREAKEKQTHEKHLAACLAREVKEKETHKKELAARLAREAEAKQTHEEELAACREQKAEAEEAHEQELAFKNEQLSEVISRYQALHALHEETKLRPEEECTRLPDQDLIRRFKSDIAMLQKSLQVQVSL